MRDYFGMCIKFASHMSKDKSLLDKSKAKLIPQILHSIARRIQFKTLNSHRALVFLLAHFRPNIVLNTRAKENENWNLFYAETLPQWYSRECSPFNRSVFNATAEFIVRRDRNGQSEKKLCRKINRRYVRSAEQNGELLRIGRCLAFSLLLFWMHATWFKERGAKSLSGSSKCERNGRWRNTTGTARRIVPFSLASEASILDYFFSSWLHFHSSLALAFREQVIEFEA